jgi:coatomer protein complex subunit epsilon
MSRPDQLFTLRNLYWVGNFQGAINESNTLTKLHPTLQTEKLEYLYRSYVALGQNSIVMSEVRDSEDTPASLRAVRLLAVATSDGSASAREAAFAKMRQLSSGNSVDKTVAVVAATLFLIDDNVKDAFGVLIRSVAHPERDALQAQISLKMDRPDLAAQCVKSIKTADDDHVLGKLATAWTYLYTGSGKVQEAVYLYEELIEKYSGSAMLLNGLAVAKMHLGRFEDAESSLQDAISKVPNDADTLANMIVVSQHLQRPPDVVARYINQLRSRSPNHPLLVSLAAFEASFDKVASSLSK